jgi:thiamine pyrophosphate-dependent acetolactate synthase large subunit-like protein
VAASGVRGGEDGPRIPRGAQLNELGRRSTVVSETPELRDGSDDVWGSDLIAAILRELDIPYVAIVPGSSLRGLQDSIVNHLGNRTPQVLLAIHEATAVSIAHGYAKVTGRTMAAAVHANVGLMNAVMGVYNAWCDRVPLLLLGATGPWDAARRRPWIDWIHTSADQGALVRNFTKWDDQPGSPIAAAEAVLRAVQIAETAPRGPVYVNLDVSVQEGKMAALPQLPSATRYAAPSPAAPHPDHIAEAARLLSEAKQPVILAGRCSRDVGAWNQRVALAEKLGAAVLTTTRLPAAFPTDHPLHAAAPALVFDRATENLVAQADVVLSLDWLDLAGALRQTVTAAPFRGQVIHVSSDAHSHRGWSKDHQGIGPVDVYMICEPDAAVPLLLEAVSERRSDLVFPSRPDLPPVTDILTLRSIAAALESETRDLEVCYTRLPLGWNGAYLHWRHPLDYVGHDGGAGIGSGPGMTVGAALALRDTGRIPMALLGDGDFLMDNTAVWTAVHHGIPALFVVCNNQSFLTDEVYQTQIAEWRRRPTENVWIGHRLDSPDIDIAAMARAQGAVGIGPVADAGELQAAIRTGIDEVRAGRVCVIDVRVK